MMDDSLRGTRSVTAMFDNSAEAERAVARLRSVGVPDSQIRHTQGSSQGYTGTVNYDDRTYRDQHKGFWDSLGDFFFPEEDRYGYAEGLARGSHMVTVSGFDPAMHDTITDVLDNEGSIDMDDRESEWRSSGWTGYQSTAREPYADPNDISGTGGMAGASSGQVATGAAGMSAATNSSLGTEINSANTRGTIYDDGMQDRSVQMAADQGGERFYSDLGPGAGPGTGRQQQGSTFGGAGGQAGAMDVTGGRPGYGRRDTGIRTRRVRSYYHD